MGSSIYGKKLYTIPNMTAPGVPMKCISGRPREVMRRFTNPPSSRMASMEYVRMSRFIHIGSMASIRRALCVRAPVREIAYASGYATRRHTTVAIIAKHTESRNVSE